MFCFPLFSVITMLLVLIYDVFLFVFRFKLFVEFLLELFETFEDGPIDFIPMLKGSIELVESYLSNGISHLTEDDDFRENFLANPKLRRQLQHLVRRWVSFLKEGDELPRESLKVHLWRQGHSISLKEEGDEAHPIFEEMEDAKSSLEISHLCEQCMQEPWRYGRALRLQVGS